MDSIRGWLYYFEAVFLPELATYETKIASLTALIVIILSLVVFKFAFGARGRGRYICLVGLSDAGKTLLYTRLCHGHFIRTQTSIQENKGTYENSCKKGKQVELVDIPGNERVRERIYSKYKDNLRALLVVVDSVNFPHEVRGVAELLFDLLSSKSTHKRKLSILVACNKQDHSLAKSCDLIREQLEKEITALRVSRSAKLSSLEGPKAEANIAFLGKRGKDFEFVDLPLKVEFAPCSARGKGEEGNSVAEVDSVKFWIERLL